MNRQRAIAGFVILMLSLPLLVPAGASEEPVTPATHRLVVPLESHIRRADVEGWAWQAGGHLHAAGPGLGYAVVSVRDVEAFRRAAESAGVIVESDARARAAADLVVANIPLDPSFGYQWGPQELRMPQAWQIENGSRAVTVAIVDSGIDASHPDLVDAAITFGFDHVDRDSDPDDQNGHGTHVAGIIAATRDNTIGVAGMADVRLLVIRVLDRNNVGYCSDFAAGIREAADAGADIINLSLYCSADVGILRDAVAYAAAKGALIVAAAGNFGPAGSRCVTFPARYAEVMAVAAVDRYLNVASFSCRGPEVEIAAPGVSVLSTVPGDGNAYYSGTSMAAPHVAAVAALMKSRNASLDALALRQVLRATALDRGDEGWDPAYGDGLVDPVNALSGARVWAPLPR